MGGREGCVSARCLKSDGPVRSTIDAVPGREYQCGCNQRTRANKCAAAFVEKNLCHAGEAAIPGDIARGSRVLDGHSRQGQGEETNDNERQPKLAHVLL